VDHAKNNYEKGQGKQKDLQKKVGSKFSWWYINIDVNTYVKMHGPASFVALLNTAYGDDFWRPLPGTVEPGNYLGKGAC